MTETQSSGALDVIDEDTVIVVFVHGEVESLGKDAYVLSFMFILCIYALSIRYSNIPFEDMQRSCPACRGTCNCKVCLRRDNLVKVIYIWME